MLKAAVRSYGMKCIEVAPGVPSGEARAARNRMANEEQDTFGGKALGDCGRGTFRPGRSDTAGRRCLGRRAREAD